MGFGLRFREKVKQVGKKNTTQPDKYGFVPTTYERTQLTYDEAVKFAESLKLIRKRIAEANVARTKMFRDVEATLTGSLPCIHEIDPVTGEHSTSEAAPEGAANYVHTGTLTRMSEENDIKIQHQVFDPIDKWISEVDLFKGKMKILENLRLELDGSRRDHISIENKIAKAEQKNTEVDAKHTTHIQSKDASVAGKRTAFEQYEAQLYEELQTIIGETGVLHNALDRTLKLEIEAYQKALDPISSTTQRLEQLGTASGSSQGTPASSVAGYGAGTGLTGVTSEKSGYGASGGQAGYGGGQQGGYGGGQAAPGLQYPAYATSTAGAGGGGGNLPNPPTHSAQQSSVVHPPSAPPSGVGYEKPYAS